MKKYIQGRKFDTSTAKQVWTKNNGFGVNALNYTEETLYLKKSGVYFLYQKSGPLGDFAIKKGQENVGRELITPLTYKEALKWASNKIPSEIFSKYFDKPTEDQTRVIRSYSFSKQAVAILKRANQVTGIDQSDLLEKLIIDNLAKYVKNV